MTENNGTALKRLLVVDDDNNVRLWLVKMFKAMGYDCVGAGSGEAGLEEARRFPPDLAVLDVWMPDLKGPEVARRLLSMPETRQVRIVFISGQQDMRDLMEPMAELAEVPFVSLAAANEGKLAAVVRKALGAPAPPAKEGASENAALVRCGPFQVDAQLGAVRIYGREVRLGPSELKLLLGMFQHPEGAGALDLAERLGDEDLRLSSLRSTASRLQAKLNEICEATVSCCGGRYYLRVHPRRSHPSKGLE